MSMSKTLPVIVLSTGQKVQQEPQIDAIVTLMQRLMEQALQQSSGHEVALNALLGAYINLAKAPDSGIDLGKAMRLLGSAGQAVLNKEQPATAARSLADAISTACVGHEHSDILTELLSTFVNVARAHSCCTANASLNAAKASLILDQRSPAAVAGEASPNVH